MSTLKSLYSTVLYSILLLGDVDLCLVPEVAIELEGENGCLPFLKQRVAEQGHAVVVVAEGESSLSIQYLEGSASDNTHSFLNFPPCCRSWRRASRTKFASRCKWKQENARYRGQSTSNTLTALPLSTLPSHSLFASILASPFFLRFLHFHLSLLPMLRYSISPDMILFNSAPSSPLTPNQYFPLFSSLVKCCYSQ